MSHQQELDALIRIMNELERLFEKLDVKVKVAGFERESYYTDVVGDDAHGSLSDGTMVLTPSGPRLSTTQAEYAPAEHSQATYVILFKHRKGRPAVLKHVQVIDPLNFNWKKFRRDLGFLLWVKIPRLPHN